MGYRHEQSNQGTLGAWYNDWGDFWGDVTTIVSRAPQVARQAQTVTTNIPNIGKPSIPVSTLVYAGLGLGALLVIDDVMQRRRR